MSKRSIYEIWRPQHVDNLRKLRAKIAMVPADERGPWKRRLRAAQRDAKRFRDECRA